MEFGSGAASVHETVEQLKEACTTGNGRACRNLGILYVHGRAMSDDTTTYAELFERACELGDALGCYNWAVVLQQRNDYDASARVMRMACDLGSMDGCYGFARLSYLGKGTPRNAVLAIEFWLKACDGGDANGCKALALAYQEGVGVKRDSKKVAELHRNACDLDPHACAAVSRR